jgi:hypothetical protein
MRFAAPWDSTLRLATWIVSGVLVAVALLVARLAATSGDPVATAFGAVLAALVLLVLALSWAFAPTGYTVERDAVRVERRARAPLEIPLAAVRAVGPLPDRAVLRALRLGGSGGLFGWYGRHWTRALGELRVHATRRTGLVQLDTPDARWVLTPEPADRFVEEVLARAPGAALAPPEGPHAAHPLPRRFWLRIAALVAVVPAVAAAVVIGSFAWAPDGVTVDAEAVRIQRLWARPVELPLASIRDARPVTRDLVAGMTKVAGFTGPGGYAFGRFRSPRLGEFRLYLWNRGPWVVLDTDAGRVVLTPGDEAFLERVRAGMGPRDPAAPATGTGDGLRGR